MPDDRGETDRPKVKVTDKRRVRPDEEPSEGTGREGAGGIGGSETSEASRRSGAPPATGEPPAEQDQPEAGPSSELEAARNRAAEYLDHLQRLKAEFENYRKRVLKEQTRAVELASEGLMLKLLEVLDEFELALVAAEQTPDLERFAKGVDMVYAKLREILRSEGLERIEAEGTPFDPERHEALFQAGEGGGEPHVAEVLRPGYTLKGKVLRPAGVKVERR